MSWMSLIPEMMLRIRGADQINAGYYTRKAVVKNQGKG